VDTLVDSKGRSLDELLPAIRILAYVRTDTTMDTLWEDVSKRREVECRGPKLLTMTCEVTASGKPLPAS
jgi:hypothetical protein